MIKDIFKPFFDRNKIIDSYSYNSNSIEILIHTKNSFRGMFSHADFVIYDKVYTYGSYDVCNSHLFNAYGDGILIICDKKDYFDFCKSLNKTVYVFDFNSNNHFINDVIERVNCVIDNSLIYNDYVQNSYIDRLSKSVSLSSYRLSNNFKNYNFINNNCVDFIKCMLNINANFHTPGELYTFLINNSINVKKIE